MQLFPLGDDQPPLDPSVSGYPVLLAALQGGRGMGMAWVTNDTGPIALPPEPEPYSHAGPRHRRPTLLSRGGQVVAGRLTALTRVEPSRQPRHPGTSLGSR